MSGRRYFISPKTAVRPASIERDEDDGEEDASEDESEEDAAFGSARKPRVIPKWQVVEGTENMHGGCGPDFALIYLRGGRVLEVGDEGVNVYRSFAHFVSGHLATQSLTFQCTAADSPSDEDMPRHGGERGQHGRGPDES